MSKNNEDFFKEKNSWSVIKDRLLGCYLAPYFQKVLMTKKPIFYVDCFAGKGKFEDGNDGSPLIALKAREDCLNRTNRPDLLGAIKTCFIDLNYAQELQTNIDASNVSYDAPEVLSGKYEDIIEDCLKRHSGENVFLYIDPYGIKALDSTLFDRFESIGFNTFEMLINFNSFGFFRDACRVMKVDYSHDKALQDLDDLVEYDPTYVSSNTKSRELLSNIAGGDYWMKIVQDYNDGKIDGYRAEKRLSTEFKQRLRQRYSYVLDMPIRLKAGNRPKYRMIHVCDHEDGCFLMAQNMQLRKDELFINIQQGGQYSIFDYDPNFTSTTEGEWTTKPEIEAKIKYALDKYRGGISITKFIANFVNEFGLICDFRMIYDIMEELSAVGYISIERDPAKTKTGRNSRFWEEKKNQSVTVRRI